MAYIKNSGVKKPFLFEERLFVLHFFSSDRIGMVSATGRTTIGMSGNGKK